VIEVEMARGSRLGQRPVSTWTMIVYIKQRLQPLGVGMPDDADHDLQWNIVAGAGLSPQGHELCFVSIDSAGTPGDLNGYVLRTLGISTTELPTADDLTRGFSIRYSQPQIAYVVTVASPPSSTESLLFQNLSNALEIILNPGRSVASIWIPLMGTGVGGLSAEVSLEFTLKALRSKADRLRELGTRLTFSLGPDITDTNLLERLTSTLRSFTSEVGATLSTAAEPYRKFSDDLRTLTDAPPIEPGLNFPHIARSIVQLVKEVTAGADPALATVERERDRLWITAKEARLTIGLFAPWGAGKSTLINALRTQFFAEDYRVFVLNPWKWDGKADLHDYVRSVVIQQASLQKGMWWLVWYVNARSWLRANGARISWGVVTVALVLAFRNQIGALIDAVTHKSTVNSADAKSALDALLEKVHLEWLALVAAPVVLKLLAERAGKIIDKWLFASAQAKLGADGLSQAYRDISSLVRREGETFRPFIFFFDDLDRCQPDRIVNVLESVHSLTSAGCVVFIACDDQFVAASILVQYEKLVKTSADWSDFGKRYLAKIVQVAFRLPLVRNQDIYELGIAQLPPGAPQVGGAASSQSPASASVVRSQGAAPVSPARRDPINGIRLREILSRLLGDTVEPLGLNIRQVKSIANTMKLYLGIDGTEEEPRAIRLAAFVLADSYDPEWLDAFYAGDDLSSTRIGSAPGGVSDRLISLLNEDRDDLVRFYHLLGRRPPASKGTATAAN
jgi:hypothetical protein